MKQSKQSPKTSTHAFWKKSEVGSIDHDDLHRLSGFISLTKSNLSIDLMKELCRLFVSVSDPKVESSLVRILGDLKSKKITKALIHSYPTLSVHKQELILQLVGPLCDVRSLSFLDKEWRNRQLGVVFRCYAFESLGFQYSLKRRRDKLIQLIQQGFESDQHIKLAACYLCCLLPENSLPLEYIRRISNDPVVLKRARQEGEFSIWIFNAILKESEAAAHSAHAQVL